MKGLITIWMLLAAVFSLSAVDPNDIIINEVYFNTMGAGKNFEAVELLVVKDQADLNNLQISDRDRWEKVTEDQCTLSDLGQGFLSAVPSGTLVVIHNGNGTDDTNYSDFVLHFYVKSSLYCNASPTGSAFLLSNHGDNVHLLHSGQQVDFVKFIVSNEPNRFAGDPGNLVWHGGVKSFIDIGLLNENAGIRFIGNTPDLNDFLATWQVYSESQTESGNLGKPNGGRNDQWILSLREKAEAEQALGSKKKTGAEK